MHDEIVVVAYDASWPQAFAAARLGAEAALGPLAYAIEHIGSTAVAGLSAKPVIDLLAGLVTFDSSRAPLPSLLAAGWQFPTDLNETLDGRRFYMRTGASGVRTHHLHLVAYDGPLWLGYLQFRDALRSSPALAREYETLKLALADRFRDDRERYTASKTDFVTRVLGRAPPSDRRLR